MLEYDSHLLYREVIMEHYKTPNNKKTVTNLKSCEIKNPTCGDVVSVQIKLNKDNIITDVFFNGTGCAISMASSSIMTQVLKGKTLQKANEVVLNFKKLVTGKDYDKDISFLDGQVFSSIQNYPARYKCATIAWDAVESLINEKLNK